MSVVEYHEIAGGHLATVVTWLEMRSPPPLADVTPPEGVTFRDVPAPDVVWYRDLIRRVGAEWLWVSRLKMNDADLLDIIADPKVQLVVPDKDGVAEGILELDYRTPGECEIAFFGLTRALIGSGTGRALMNEAIRRAFGAGVERLHLHTCTLDHPGALGFYRSCGYVPWKQGVEVIEDPRLSGLLPAESGARWPVIGRGV